MRFAAITSARAFLARPGRKTLLLAVAVTVSLATNSAVAGLTYGLESYAPGPGVPSSAPTYLYSFDDNTHGAVTNLGALNGGKIDADALAWSSTYGLIAFSVSSGAAAPSMLGIDPGTATATSKGFSYANRDIRGAVFDAADNLWVADAANEQLLRISPTSGGVLQTINLTLPGAAFDLSNATDIAIARDGTFFLVNAYDIYVVDTGTGTLTLQHNFAPPGISTHALAGAAFSTDGPHNVLFGYEINGTDDIYQYDITAGYASTTFDLDFISGFNAGRGDLATITPVPVPGAALLGLFGLGAAGMRLRRRASA